MMQALFYIFIFPGFLFLFIFGFAAEFIDRKLYARFQNRKGPPWYQPVADFVKLIGKENLIPGEADVTVFKMMPIIALTTIITSVFYIPLWSEKALFSFTGDVIVVLYLLTIPTITYFLAGWYSRSIYSMIGAVRSLTQLFAYEVPLFLCILSPSLMANTWSLSGMTAFYEQRPWFWLFNIIGFIVAIISLLGKLEKVPFDIPEAETEIVAGAFTEYGGKLLALFKMSLNIELVAGSALLASVFLPFGLNLGFLIGFIVFIIKVLFMVFLISLARSVFARLRLDQMIDICWKYFALLAFLQVLISLVVKEFLL